MNDAWYYTADGHNPLGPVPFGELRRLAATGALHPAHLVRAEGETAWRAAGQVPGLFARAAGSEVISLPPPSAGNFAEQATLAPAADAGAAVPISVPGYEILEELGRGGMGVVYKARQTALKRLVALKMILAGQHAGPEQMARFRAEAEAIARLQHPHVVQVHDVGQHEGKPYFALEYIGGGSLAGEIHGTPWKARRAAVLVEKLARATHTVHQQGIIHRDLKPANILLTLDDEPKITDFGLAKQLDAGTGQTATGTVLGTPSYMAPEQAGGKKSLVGPAADIYALGAILYELLTGRPPFQADTPLDTLMKVVSEEPVPPSQLRPRLARDLEAICLKCLRKEPAARYASAQALADDLARYLDGDPVQARKLHGRELAGRWLQAWPAPKVLLGVALVYLILAALSDAVTAASYTAVPLLVVLLTPFLWPRAIVLALSGSGLVLLLLTELFLYLLEAQAPSASFQRVLVLTALHLTRGLFLGLVGLGFAWLLGRDRLATTLGALFGFGLAFRECATALWHALGAPAVPGSQVAERLALPSAFPTLRPTFPDQALAQADVAALSSAVLVILALGLLPAGIGALLGGALAGRTEKVLPRWRRLSIAVAGTAVLVGLSGVWWCGSVPVLQARREMAALQAQAAPQPPPAVLPDLGLKFARVPRGSFWMGGGGGRPGTKQVDIPYDFDLGVHEVTQGQWQALMGHNPSWFSRTGRDKDAVKDIPDAELQQFPVENVSWDDAQEFIKRLNALKKNADRTYRLPTEVEWEYACRGGAFSKEACSFDFYLDKPTNDLSSTQANFNGAFPGGNAAKGPYLGRTAKVGSYPPNGLGICDLHGNVWEWCQDSVDGGPDRVIRGGCWYDFGSYCRAAFRYRFAPSYRDYFLGLRLALVPWGR